mgnify:CR=1 FL=1
MDAYSLGFEGLNGLEGCANVVGDGLELLQELLGLVNDSLVLQNGAVMSEVDGGGLIGVGGRHSLGVSVTLAEGLDSSNGLCENMNTMFSTPTKPTSTHPFRVQESRRCERSPGGIKVLVKTCHAWGMQKTHDSGSGCFCGGHN